MAGISPLPILGFFKKAGSTIPFLGTDEDKKGDMPDL
jgi:hypothetical protein